MQSSVEPMYQAAFQKVDGKGKGKGKGKRRPAEQVRHAAA
jgi:hypothetical protein